MHSHKYSFGFVVPLFPRPLLRNLSSRRRTDGRVHAEVNRRSTEAGTGTLNCSNDCASQYRNARQVVDKIGGASRDRTDDLIVANVGVLHAAPGFTRPERASTVQNGPN